jgi:hypothetical protein
MLTEARLLQSINAPSPIAVTPGGMTTAPPLPVYLTSVLSRISKAPAAGSCPNTAIPHTTRKAAKNSFLIITPPFRKPAAF